MSTILKALKRLEHDKQTEAARAATHDPLAPALDAPEPKPAARRSWTGPLVVAVMAAFIGAGLSYGLASWWFSQDGRRDAATDVAAGTPSKGPLAAIPDAPRVSPEEAPPVGGVEAAPHATIASPSAGPEVGRSVVAQVVEAPDPDPWEAAARAAPSDEPARDPAAAQKKDNAEGQRAVGASQTQSASSRASSTASRAASSPGANASSATSGSAAAPSPPSAAPAPTRREAHLRSIEGARPVSSLPEVALPEPEPAAPTPAPAELAKRSAPKPATPAEPASTGQPEPEPEDATVKVEAPDSRLEILVVKTVWHPKSERRSARLRVSDRVEAIEVREQDVVEGYVVLEITPSSVVLGRDDVVVTRRVGR